MDYPRTRQSAAKSIKKAGKRAWVISRQRTGGTERNPIYSDTATPIWCVELNQRLRNRDGSMAPGVVHSLMISTEGVDFELDNTMSVTFIENGTGADVISIAEVRPLRPGPVTLLWEADLNG